MKTIGIAGAFSALIFLPSPVTAHGGGLNAEGCHNNRKTGDYHCHRAPAAPVAARSVSPTGGATRPATSSGGSSGNAYYANCAAARAAGAAPLRRGNPGYREAMDRDGDGVACE